jgi:mRNA-degrading endonuclease YafQ of YafQ-DinJ toxin-antitoxin module
VRVLKRNPQAREQHRKMPMPLEANPYHSSLRLHALSGKLSGLHSVSINLSLRITLELLIREQQIVPINVGDHDAVY